MPLFSKVKDIFKSSSSVKRKKVYHNVKLQNPEEVWAIRGEIGDGAYGKVYKAENVNNGTLAALKKVTLEEDEDLDNFMVEIDILAECQHPNIVGLLEAYHWDGCLWMYLEFCDGGAVDSIMVDLDRPLAEEQIAYITHHLLKALDYVHKHKVIHRDIKAGNVLLTTDGGVKLADFGVSAKNKNTMDKRGTFIGTPYWLAPEVIKCETFIDSKYDYKADIWSLGITLIEFAQMDPPNHEVSPLRVLLKIQKADPPKLDCPSKFSKEFNDFIAACLIKNPEERPDAQQLMSHPFVSSPQNSKHIIALLIEYQADVVEEDVEEDPRASRLSLESVDQSSASHDMSVSSADLTGPRQSKEATPTGVMERRAAKGPAPPPPVAPAAAPKKGPAPSTPTALVTAPSTFPAPTASSTQTTTTSPTVSSSGPAVPPPSTPSTLAATSVSPTDSTTSTTSNISTSSINTISTVCPPVSTSVSTASTAPSVTSSSRATDASIPSGPLPSSVSSAAPTTSSAVSSSSVASAILPPSFTVAASPVCPDNLTSSALVSPPNTYIATVTSSSVTILPAADKSSSATQLPGKEESLTVNDSVPASDEHIVGPSANEITSASSAVQSIVTTAVPVFSGVVLSSNVSESNSSTSAPSSPVMSSSGVSVTVPEGLHDTSSQSVALPLSVTSDSVCLTPNAEAVVSTSSVTAETSTVSVTTLEDNYVFDDTSALLTQEKLLIEEKEEDLAPAVELQQSQPQTAVIDSTSKTQITHPDSSYTEDEHRDDSSFRASTTVVSIGDPVPAASMGDIVSNDSVPGEIFSEVDVCGTIDDVLEESLSSIDRVLVDEPDEPSLVVAVNKKSAEARQRLPDELDAPTTDPTITLPEPPSPTTATAPLPQEEVPSLAPQGPKTSPQQPSDRSAEPPAQIIASIGSEGTVIVRTPTPTPSTPSPTASTPTPNQQSLVTFSGPGVVGSPPSTPIDSPRSPAQDENFSRAAEEAVQFLDDAIGHHTSAAHDSLTSTESSANNSVVVVEGGHPQQELTISHYNTLAGESNTDDITTPGRAAKPRDVTDKSAHISVVPISQKLPAATATPDSQHLTIEGTTLEDTDVDSLVSPVKATEDARRPGEVPTTRDSSGAGVPLRHAALEDRSDSDSVSTVSSEKENNKPGGGGSSEEEVVLRHSAAARSPHSDTTSYRSIAGESVLGEDSSLRPIDRNRQNRQANLRNGRTKEENESIALRKKTRKRTRKFMIDGVVMTTTTSKVIYGDDEDGHYMSSGHLARKQELRELKMLQKQEQKQFQELGIKANAARLEQERKFESEKTQLVRTYDNDVDMLNRHQKQQVERTEAQHEVELKTASKKIRADQEKELRSFRESLKQELKLLKQEVDLLPKDVRKEALRTRREQLETDQAEREKAFLERLHQNHEASMKRLSEEHRAHVALLERQFLQKKHQLLRAREAALWELEERHLQDRHQLAKRQLKDIFFLQRHQMLLRHEKELEQVRRQNIQRQEELIKRQAVERRAMPKRIRQEMKARELMFRESMRISTSNLADSHHDEKERLRKFQECERRRYEAERKRAEQKHKRQMEELQAATEAHAKELEQMQNEKRKMLMEHETLKLKAQEEEYQKELKDWKNNLKPRKQKLEDEFEQQLMEQEQFYGAYLTTNGTTLLQSAADASNASAY